MWHLYRSMSIPKAPPGHFTLLYFASAASFTGKRYDHLPAPLALGKLSAVLEERYRNIEEKVLGSCAVTVNLDYVDLETDAENMIQEGDEVAIIPPVSSG